MPDLAVTYGARVLAKGYQVAGDIRSGLKATVPYIIKWSDCFAFTNALLAPVNSVVIGPMTVTVPYRFLGGDTPMYAQRYTITPCGADGDASIENQGLRAGEFFTHALVTVEFEQVMYSWDKSENPNNQLDPDNPLTLCEQTVKIGGHVDAVKGNRMRYVSTNKPVSDEVPFISTEAKLVLKFPRVAYLPWSLFVPYANTVNSNTVLKCPAGTLLLEGMSTEAKAQPAGVNGYDTQVVLEFSYAVRGWNKVPNALGTFEEVYFAGDSDSRLYGSSDFREIFRTLQYFSSPA